MCSPHIGSPEYNKIQLNKIINLIEEVCDFNHNTNIDSPLKILARLGYDFIKNEIINRISDEFDCRTDTAICLYYKKICFIPKIKGPEIVDYLWEKI